MLKGIHIRMPFHNWGWGSLIFQAPSHHWPAEENLTPKLDMLMSCRCAIIMLMMFHSYTLVLGQNSIVWERLQFCPQTKVLQHYVMLWWCHFLVMPAHCTHVTHSAPIPGKSLAFPHQHVNQTNNSIFRLWKFLDISLPLSSIRLSYKVYRLRDVQLNKVFFF